MRTLVIVLVGIVVCVKTCAAVHVDDSSPALTVTTAPAASQPAPRGPTALWTYPGAMQIHSMALTPDGKYAYVSMTVSGVNLWKLVVYYWPEWGGAIVLVILVCVFRRTANHEQEAGQPYCRLCNYRLTKLEASACPECGGELTDRNRVMGTRKRWTMAALLATMAMIVLGYMQFADSSQRGESIHRWFNWSSTSLEQWARTQNWVWLQRGSDHAHRLVEIELSQGTVVETTYEQLGRQALVRMLLSPSQGVLCGMDSWQGRVVFIDLETGQELVVDGNDALRDIVQISLNESTATVYAGDRLGQIWKCNLSTLKWTPCPEVYGQTVEKSGAQLAAESARAVVVSWRYTNTDQPLTYLAAEVIDLDTGEIMSKWRLEPDNWRPVTFTANGELLFCQRSDGTALLHHLTSGRTATLSFAGVTASRGVTAGPDGRLLVARGMAAGNMQVVDCASDSLVADLKSPGVWPNDMAMDANGHRLFECILDLADGRYKIAKYDFGDVIPSGAPTGDGPPSEP